MFESLLGFVAQLSLVLWSVVTLTLVIRFIGIRFYRRAARRALARIGAAGNSATATPEAAATGAAAAAPAVTAVVLPAIAVVPAIAAGMDLLQPANIPLVDAVTNVLAANPVDG
jgi:multisubunit Na+/H+ antiporter MnhC subunit